MSRTIRRGLVVALSMMVVLPIGCVLPSQVDEHWGEAYRENTEAMIADPAAEAQNAGEPAPQGMDGVTAEDVMRTWRAPADSASEPLLPMIVTDTESLGSR